MFPANQDPWSGSRPPGHDRTQVRPEQGRRRQRAERTVCKSLHPIRNPARRGFGSWPGVGRRRRRVDFAFGLRRARQLAMRGSRTRSLWGPERGVVVTFPASDTQPTLGGRTTCSHDGQEVDTWVYLRIWDETVDDCRRELCPDGILCGTCHPKVLPRNQIRHS